MEPWIIAILRIKNEEGVDNKELKELITDLKEYSLIAMDAPPEEVDRILQILHTWGIVKKRGNRYYLKLDELDDSIRNVLIGIAEEEIKQARLIFKNLRICSRSQQL